MASSLPKRFLLGASSLTLVLLLMVPRLAFASPWFGASDERAEELFLDGDLDADDLLAPGAMRRGSARGRAIFAPTWLSLGAFGRARDGAWVEVGAVLVLGIPLERTLVAPQPATERPGIHEETSRRPPPHEEASSSTAMIVTPELARGAVAAAWRAAGIGARDAHLDAMGARARLSGLLPEARLRAMRTEDQSARVDSLPEQQKTSDTSGANVWLEARLTWRLDRLVYSDDEPQVERLRIDGQEARTRVAAKVLELLFRWQRGVLEARAAVATSPEAIEAAVRSAESEVALDVLTGGWFSAWRTESASSVTRLTATH